MMTTHRGSKVPRPGQAVEVVVGAPVPVEDLLAAAATERWDDDQLYRRIADRIGLALQQLYARLHDKQQLEGLPCIDDDALMPLIGSSGVYAEGHIACARRSSTEDELMSMKRQHGGHFSVTGHDRWAWRKALQLPPLQTASMQRLATRAVDVWKDYCSNRAAVNVSLCASL